MDEIAMWRRRIDEIDEQLVMLLNERAVCAVEIGKAKKEKGMEIYNPVREKSVIQHVCQLNKGPFDSAAVQRIFETIIEKCKKIERI